MEVFIKGVLGYFKAVKQGQDKIEQSIATTLESSFDIFVKMLYMKKNQHHQGYRPFLFTEFFTSTRMNKEGKEEPNDSRIFLHTIEEVSRENIPFIAAFLSLLFKIQLSQTIGLYINKEKALETINNQENKICIEINVATMTQKGYKFIEDIEDVWYTKKLPSKYLSYDKITE